MRLRGNILPLGAVTTGALIVLVVVPLIIRHNKSGQLATVDAHVSIGDAVGGSGSSADSQKYRWPDSEVPRTAERLRDVSAIAVATMSYAVERVLNGRRPVSAEDILANVAQRNLIPKEWLSTQPGVLQMRNGTVHLRYSSADLSVELISVPRDRLDGPAFLIRLPDTENTSGAARYFESMQLDGVVYPAAFAPIPEVISCGWQPRLFKQTQLPDVERAQLEQWARTNSNTP